MKILTMKQGSPDWFKARMGLPTASEFDRLITPLGKLRTGDGPQTFLVEKLAERWTGKPQSDYYSRPMENGTIRQDHAIGWLAFEHNIDIKEVGFILSDDGRYGCSPDGLLLPQSGVEVKCPILKTQIGWLLDGELPKEHTAQVQGSMLVTGAKVWKFLAYSEEAPNLLLDVERDDKFCDTLAEGLAAFCERLDAAYKRLVELNGGERVKEDLTGLAAADAAAFQGTDEEYAEMMRNRKGQS